MEEVAHTAHEVAAHAEQWYEDPGVWITVSFLLFIALFARFVLPLILRGLDSRATDIADQLQKANQLRAEAEALLAEYQRKHKEAEAEARELVKQAKKDATELRKQAEKDLKEALARRTAQAEEQIRRAEADAVREIRAQLVDSATETARQVIITQLKDQKDDPAVARALQSIERNLH